MRKVADNCSPAVWRHPKCLVEQSAESARKMIDDRRDYQVTSYRLSGDRMHEPQLTSYLLSST